MENDYEDCDDVKEDLHNLSDLIELVKFVQENPLLWNQIHPHFKNRDKKDLKWMLIGSHLTNPLSGEEAKKRFNNLRTTFGKLHKKVCNSEPRSGAGGNHQLFKPDWPLYEHMLFLRDVIRPRKSKTSGVLRKIEENFTKPKIPKQRKIMTKISTAQPIINLAPPTNSAIPLLNMPCIKDSVCESKNNINTSQNVSPEEPIIPDEIFVIPEVSQPAQPCNLANNSWTETTDTESDAFVTPPPDQFYKKKKKNEEELLQNIRDVVGVLKDLFNSNIKAPIVQSQPSSSDHALSPTAEALLAFVKASLNKVKEENLMNCFQDVLNLFQKYIEK